LDQEEFTEFLLWIVLREDLLNGILESKVKCLGWEVADNVGEVTSPESSNTLFRCDTGEAVNDTSLLVLHQI